MSEIVALATRLRSGSVTCEAVTRAALQAIERLEPSLNAFISVTGDQAIATARKRDIEFRAGQDRGPLHGIPIVLKDNIDTAGVRTTIGSFIFRDRIPARDAAIVRRLEASGVVTLGKSNMNELAAGGPGGYNKFFGSTRNPWNPEHESGGSSSGTGAAVAAGICAVGVGSDSGGSIRGPASHMGVVGLRPTIGRMDMHGIFPRAPSLDTCGPLASSVRDAAILFDALLGESKTDGIGELAETDLNHIRLGFDESWSLTNVQEDVVDALHSALRAFERLGARVVSVRLPELAQQTALLDASRVLLYEFAREFGDTYRGVADSAIFGPVVQSDMARAAEISPAEYEAAMQSKHKLAARISEQLRDVDALVTPTMSRTAPPIDQPDLSGAHRRFTLPVSFAGLPALSIPCGLDRQGLPIGLQLFGERLQEHNLLAIAYAYERATTDHRMRPAKHVGFMHAL